MLTTVQFDDNGSLEAHEIQNVIGERVLPTKFAVLDLPAAQALPKHMLSIRRCIAQPALQPWSENRLLRLSFHDACQQHHPHPTLPLKGGVLGQAAVLRPTIISFVLA